MRSIHDMTRRSVEHDFASCVIIGNGIAGMTAAVQARRLAPDLSISLVTDQHHPTINTPALKQLTTRTITPEQLLSFPAGTEREAQLTMIHAHVERIDATQKVLFFADGHSYGYHTLLIATGSRPVGLSPALPGYDLDGVLTLHRLRDYLDLSRRLRLNGEVKSVVVVGGGIHASETAMGLRSLGLEVNWLIRGERFASRLLDQRASEISLEHFQHSGIHIWLNTELVGIIGRMGMVTGVVTTSHSFLPADLVLVCTGTTPVTSLAQACTVPLQYERGLFVDDHLQTSAPDIYAAGDSAAVKNPWTGNYEPRAQWAAAAEQGRAAAGAITGYADHQPHAFGTSWHAAQIGELSLLTVGMPPYTAGTKTLSNEGEEEYYCLTIAQDQLIGYLALGHTPVDGLGVKRLIDEGLDWREVADELLAGSFDIRTFLTRHHVVRLLSGREAQDQVPAPVDPPLPENISSSGALLPLGKRTTKLPVLYAHRPLPLIEREVRACIGCNECLYACPALAEPLTIDRLNQETLSGPASDAVIRFTRACYQCGACVSPCPIGLHRDAMMMWLKVSLLRSEGDGKEEAGYANP